MNFRDWYCACHGYEPFPWQESLAERIAAGSWPEALTPPTGAGKTAVIDVWLWARLEGLSVPTRLVYVIDRRLIVDSVSTYATALAQFVPADQRPTVATMRGGISIDDTWLDPVRSAIIVTTVDQAGSRLLFHGYGVSRNTAPIHAALLGNDVLWVLDEVHLAAPLQRTLSDVQTLRAGGLPMPFVVMPMSATYNGKNTLGLGHADHQHPVLSRRIRSGKPVALGRVNSEEELIAALVEETLALRSAGADVVAAVCNRVATARKVFQHLSAKGEAILLTGRVRPCDRESINEEYLPRIVSGSRGNRAPLFVVATQTIEVGADLDFDGLVTECAPLSALRQRAGRLNRLGELDHAPMRVVYFPRKEDRVYGEQVAEAWSWLQQAETLSRGAPIDFGIDAISHLAESLPLPEEPTIPSPALLAGHLDILSLTSIDSRMRLEPWLHGWQEAAVDVYLCWRADPSVESVEAAPPARDELLSLPIYALKAWMADVADIECTSDAASEPKPLPCLVWDGESAIALTTDRVRPGTTLVLDTKIGGCDRWGWAPDSRAEVRDAGNTARRLRLHPALQPELGDEIRDLKDTESSAAGWQAMARKAGFGEPGRVLAYPGGALILARSEWTSAAAIKPIPLNEHLGAVGLRAEELARQCRLPEEIVVAVRRAGHAHDLGKADPRWQAAVGGDGTTLLAKGPGGDAGWLGLARGWRHEMASALRQEDPLVRHLVGSHHGHGRPLFPAAPDIELWRKLSGWAEQFANLQAEYGWWGLAYLEALVRLADWQVSEEEQR
jgi:CRISPR-associated endonuclease/helicase Cas3